VAACAVAQSRRNTRRKVRLRGTRKVRVRLDKVRSARAPRVRAGLALHARRVCSPIRESPFRRDAKSPSRRVFDRTGIVNSSRASGSRKSVSASSRKSEADCRDQAGSPRSPKEDPAAATGSVERAGSKKISCIGSRRHQSATTTCNGGEGLAPKGVNYRANVAIAD